MSLLNGKVRINSVIVPWGSLGKGMMAAHKGGSQFLHDLKRAGFNIDPVNVVSPSTVARCKNALTLHEFYACRNELDKLLTQFVPGSIYALSAVGLGGGTANFGILMTDSVCQMTEYSSLRIYLSHELFQGKLAYEEIARRYINSNMQLALVGMKLTNNKCSVEVMSMSTMLNQFGNSYDSVDAGLHDCWHVIMACSAHPSNRFDLEDMLSNPQFRVRTCAFSKISISGRYEAMITRTLAAMRELKPFMDDAYFSKNTRANIIGSPLIIVAGPRDLVNNIENAFDKGSSYVASWDEVEKLLESKPQDGSNATIIPFPVELDSVYLSAIYPVDEKWFLSQCSAAKKKILEWNEKARRNTSDALLVRVFKSMMVQAGNPRLEDFLGVTS